MNTSGLVSRPRTIAGKLYHRWDVVSARALKRALTDGNNAPFADELVAKARSGLPKNCRFDAEGITGVRREKDVFSVEVTFFKRQRNSRVVSRQVVVEVIEPSTYSTYDLRARFGKVSRRPPVDR